MATLAENFLADLDELSEGEEEEQQPQDRGGVEEDGDDEGKGNGDDKVRLGFASFGAAAAAPSCFLLFPPTGARREKHHLSSYVFRSAH